MKIVIVYATREGQTRKIVEHIAATLRARDIGVDLFDARRTDETVPLESYAAALVAASVHYGKHDKEMVAFVERHRDALAALPCAFLSVSAAAASAAETTASAEVRARAAINVRTALDLFFRQTGWKPPQFLPVAGALLYTKYNFFIRYVIRWIAKRSGVSIDTKHDHEYTDWAALDRFVASFLGPLAAPRHEPAPHVSL